MITIRTVFLTTISRLFIVLLFSLNYAFAQSIIACKIQYDSSLKIINSIIVNSNNKIELLIQSDVMNIPDDTVINNIKIKQIMLGESIKYSKEIKQIVLKFYPAFYLDSYGWEMIVFKPVYKRRKLIGFIESGIIFVYLDGHMVRPYAFH